ncbi:oligosaccharide flippase family protein [Rossellomorea vietnamensis]|uniref:Oligosaccharide flippase family protein n=1 Tax=Rossellomorea vietnamensis TaxID=218284 RepID=A0A5D4K5H6_9BACI|nr:oligosaccharide flippase family protein [Rossellomorea vietnamensis]TYR72627.1 oligosaccharide flippase family protein [Rossellomorea vietnamensis]
MSNKSKSIILLISKSFGLIINMISIMIIARFLSVSNYGEYRQIITVVGILVSIFSVGLPSSALYFLSGKEKDKYLPNLMFSLLLLSGAFIILSYPIMVLFNTIFSTDMFTDSYFLIAVIISLSFIVSIIENLFISYNKFKFIVIVTILPNLVFMGFILYCYFYNENLFLILLSLLIRELLKVSILLYFIYKQKLDLQSLKPSRVKEVMYFGIPLGLSTIIASLNINIDKLVVGRFMDNEAFAIISNGSYEIPILGLIGVSLFNILVPNLKSKLDTNNFSEVIELWKRTGKVMITVVVPITIGTIVFAKEVILILFSEKYLNAVFLFQIYQINALSRIYIYGSFFLAAGKSKVYTLNSIIHLTNNLVLNCLLIIPFGLVGVAIATVISNVIQIILQNFQIAKIVNSRPSALFPYKSFLKANLISIILFVLPYYIYTNIFGVNTIVGLILMMFLIIIAIIILNYTITREILDYILSFYKKLRTKN